VALSPHSFPGRPGSQWVDLQTGDLDFDRLSVQAQFSVSLGSQTGDKNALHELIVWIAEHLDEDLSVPVLASRTAMSPRTFPRVFTSSVGKSPARFVEKLRVEAARRQIERTAKSLDEIAARCGLGSAEASLGCRTQHLASIEADSAPPASEAGMARIVGWLA
jgi:transcriptional regulator GlxA family with amidase domain